MSRELSREQLDRVIGGAEFVAVLSDATVDGTLLCKVTGQNAQAAELVYGEGSYFLIYPGQIEGALYDTTKGIWYNVYQTQQDALTAAGSSQTSVDYTKC